MASPTTPASASASNPIHINRFREIFPHLDPDIIDTVVRQNRCLYEPSMNALLSLSDPDYRPEPQQQPSAPAPAPAPVPTFTLEPPQPLLQHHQAGHAVAPKESTQFTTTPLTQLQFDEAYARSIHQQERAQVAAQDCYTGSSQPFVPVVPSPAPVNINGVTWVPVQAHAAGYATPVVYVQYPGQPFPTATYPPQPGYPLMYTSPYIGTPGGVPGQYPGAASSASSDGSPTKTAPISNSTASTPPTASRKGGLSGLLKGLRRGLSTSSNGTSQQGEGSRPRSIRSRTLSVTGSDDSDNIPDARPTNPAALHMRSFSDDMSNGYNGMKSLNVPDDIRPDHSTIGYSDGLQQRQEGAAAEDPFYHPYDDAPEEKLVRRRPSPLPASSNRYSPRPSGEGTSPTDPWYTQTNPGQPRAAAPLENPFNTSIEINPATVVLTATSIPGSPTPSRASRVSMPSPWG